MTGLNFNLWCNSVQTSPNKESKPVKIKIDYKKIAYRYEDEKIIVLKPVIDRIVFGYSPLEDFIHKYDPAQSLHEYKEYVGKSAWSDANANEPYLSLDKKVFQIKTPYLYNLIFTAPSGAQALIKIGPKWDNKPLLLVDYQPSLFTDEDTDLFRGTIEEMLMTGTEGKISFDDILGQCKIKNLEISVDILGARPADMEIKTLMAKKPSPKKTATYKSKTGRVETIYLNAKAGKSTGTYIYDKRINMIEKGHVPFFGDAYHARVEVRLKNTAFYKLTNLQNHLQKMHIRVIKNKSYSALDYVFKLFVRFVLVRNLEKALEIVPLDKQASHKDAFETSMIGIWQPDKIWSFWPDTIKSHKLFIPQQK